MTTHDQASEAVRAIIEDLTDRRGDTVTAQEMHNADDPAIPLMHTESNLVRYLYAAALVRAGADRKAIGVADEAGVSPGTHEIKPAPPGFETKE